MELTSVDWLDWLITIELFTIEDHYSLDREKEDKRNFDAAAVAGGGGGRVFKKNVSGWLGQYRCRDRSVHQSTTHAITEISTRRPKPLLRLMDAYDGSCVGGNGVILIEFHVEMDHTHGDARKRRTRRRKSRASGVKRRNRAPKLRTAHPVNALEMFKSFSHTSSLCPK